MTKRLTEQQITQYREDGYICPVRLLNEDQVADCRRQLEAFESRQGEPNPPSP